MSLTSPLIDQDFATVALTAWHIAFLVAGPTATCAKTTGINLILLDMIRAGCRLRLIPLLTLTISFGRGALGVD